MKQGKINYKDLMDLGFKKGYMNCSVHQDQHGYDDFWVEKKLGKRHRITWEHNTRYAELLVMKKGKEDEGCIDKRIPIQDLAEVKKYMYIFGKLTKEEAGITEVKEYA